MSRLVFALTLFVVGLVALPARAYTPPPMTAHVTDTAHKLTEEQRLAIDRKLEDYRIRTTNEIAVFIPASLEGQPIEDVAVDTGRAWGIGRKKESNGVLLVIAPVERKAFIATGKGAEGALTDLQANDIVRQKIRPALAPGHENYRLAVDDATDAIMADLDKGGAGGAAPTRAPHPSGGAGNVFLGLLMLAIFFGIPILVFVLIISKLARAFSSGSSGPSWTTGSSWSNDSSWSSSNDSSWSSGGGGGDSGFTGGGGDFGGGGSGDSF